MSSILRRAVYPAMSGARMFPRHLRAGEVCALTYHGVFPEGFTSPRSPTDETLVSREQFRRQLRFLKSRYELITPDMFRNWCAGNSELPERAVLLTCDDGLLNALTEMVPILHEEQAKCLFFIIGASIEDGPAYLWYEELFQLLRAAGAERLSSAFPDHVGERSGRDFSVVRCWQSLLQSFSRLSWQDRQNAMDSLRTRLNVERDLPINGQRDVVAERRYRLLNGIELEELVAAGMTVGAHTMSHPVLSDMPPELAEHEIRECRARLQSYLSRAVWALAYPFGDEKSVGDREAELAKNAGFECAFMNCGGGAFGRTTSRFRLPRAHVTSAMEIPEIEARLTGLFEPIRKRMFAATAAGKDW